jgi:predicted O-methyltransferase YrrM
MFSLNEVSPPATLSEIEEATRSIGFAMGSERPTGALLRTLAASKPGGRLLELGTGTGIGTAWLLDGMDAQATLLTVDTNHEAVAVAQRYLGGDPRVTFAVEDGAAAIDRLAKSNTRFDCIFADTWPGKFSSLDETLGLLARGGLYIVDDLLPQASWPEGHPAKVEQFVAHMSGLAHLRITALDWSTGIMIAVVR